MTARTATCHGRQPAPPLRGRTAEGLDVPLHRLPVAHRASLFSIAVFYDWAQIARKPARSGGSSDLRPCGFRWLLNFCKAAARICLEPARMSAANRGGDAAATADPNFAAPRRPCKAPTAIASDWTADLPGHMALRERRSPAEARVRIEPWRHRARGTHVEGAGVQPMLHQPQVLAAAGHVCSAQRPVAPLRGRPGGA